MELKGYNIFSIVNPKWNSVNPQWNWKAVDSVSEGKPPQVWLILNGIESNYPSPSPVSLRSKG